MTKPDYIEAHKRSIRHEREIQASKVCGCFHCDSVFAPAAIQEWIDEPNLQERTALCPFCAIDSVISDASGFPITLDFLEKMRRHWFD